MYMTLGGQVIDINRIPDMYKNDLRNAISVFLVTESIPTDSKKFYVTGLLRRYACAMDGDLMVVLHLDSPVDASNKDVTPEMAEKFLNITREQLTFLLLNGKLDLAEDSKKITSESIDRYARERAKGFLLTKPME